MIAGHFGFAALVKAREPQVPLWALMLATVWLDIVFVPLYLSGIESIEMVPGARGGYGAGMIHADYTHSLLGALLLSTAFGLIATAPWGRRCGIVLGAVVFSHWILDLIVHRADMPFLPGNAGNLPKLGLCLWQVPPAAILTELLLVLSGAFFYWRAARLTEQQASGSRHVWASVAASLVLIAGCAVLYLDATGS
jgi:membrane-bound metal-dependent hydrolase YbcI (DUF457 family)